MNIVEEYIVRNKLQQIPMIHHCLSGFVVARLVDVADKFEKNIDDSMDSMLAKNNYVFISIKWNKSLNTPGSYFVQFISPCKLKADFRNYVQHSDYIDKKLLFTIISNKHVEYDDYESSMFLWLKSFAQSNKIWVVAKNKDEANFMLWESYVYMFDSYFLGFPKEIKSILCESLNSNNKKSTRITHMQKFIDFVEKDCRIISDIWNGDLNSILQEYSIWIESVVRC